MRFGRKKAEKLEAKKIEPVPKDVDPMDSYRNFIADAIREKIVQDLDTAKEYFLAEDYESTYKVVSTVKMAMEKYMV